MSTTDNIVNLLRPKQWLKNIFVFLPLFFHGSLFSLHLFTTVLSVFLIFCIAASGVYCLNDYVDIEDDKKHPKKFNRPIASGYITKNTALLIMFFCWLCSLFFAYVIDSHLFYIICLYIIINVFYCLKLKKIAIIDVFILSVGYVLRVFAGGIVIHISVTHWIILMTFLLALFLAFAKRRDDVVIYEATGFKMRSSINRYSLSFINQVISILVSIIVVCYIMYSVSPDVVERMNCEYVYFTTFFVLAGLLRYLQITIVEGNSGSPTEIIYKDHFIQGCVFSWILSFVCILYL